MNQTSPVAKLPLHKECSEKLVVEGFPPPDQTHASNSMEDKISFLENELKKLKEQTHGMKNENVVSEKEVTKTIEVIEESAIDDVAKAESTPKPPLNEVIDLNQEKFKNRIVVKNKFQSEICDWLLFEIKNHINESGVDVNDDCAPNSSGDRMSPTELLLESVKPIFNFMILSYGGIFKYMTNWYDLNEDKIKYDLIDISIVDVTNLNQIKKYSEPMNYHDSDFIIKISLCQRESEILFGDGIRHIMNIGDLLIHKTDVDNKFINGQGIERLHKLNPTYNGPCYFIIAKIKMLNLE